MTHSTDLLSARDRAIGAVVGLAVGDAVGTTLEFTQRDSYPHLTDMVGGGPFGLEPGQWTDDTSMALCLADSLLACDGLDQHDLCSRFLRWWREGENSCTGDCFDIGNTIKAALIRFDRTGDPAAGSDHPSSAGNGSLMRLAPVALFFAHDGKAAREAARAQSETTHRAAAALDACDYFAGLLVEAICGASKQQLLRPRQLTDSREVARIAAGSWKGKPRHDIRSTGYVIDTLEAALWAIEQADDFQSAVLLAANLGDDADTVAAVTGQLAGALWGARGIPEHWRQLLAWHGRIEDLASRLAARATGNTPELAQSDRYHHTNSDLLEGLISDGRICIPDKTALARLPQYSIPSVPADRWRGMLLGLAIGDALGNTSEGQLPWRRRESFGEIRDYLPSWHADNRSVGLPSDDTQLSFWTIEQLLEDGCIDPDGLAKRFAKGQIFGIGSSVRAFIRDYKSGVPWPEASSVSAGNGALMRIAPVVLQHLGRDSQGLWVDAVLCGAVTHNDTASISACLAFAGMLAQLLDMTDPPAPMWWPETYVSLARHIDADTVYALRGGCFTDFEGPLSRFVAQEVSDTFASGLDTLNACNRWYSGAYLLETVPSVLYILMRHGHDPEEAIVRAVNDTKDNDTIAAIVGAAVGALHGERRLPQRWRENLSGRTTAYDDGHIFSLLDEVQEKLVR